MLDVHWHWQQWVWMIMELVTLATYLVNHGKPRGNYTALAGVFNFAVSMWLLISGGFFR